MGINWKIQKFDSVESTQATCFELARDGAEEGAVVHTQQQTAGKGRQGRVWETGDGNLAFSCLLKPQCDTQIVGQLALVVGVALAKTFKLFSTASISLKWPNDVFLEGKKCAGVLIESELTTANVLNFVVIGVGVNIAEAPEYAHALNDYAGQPINVDELLKKTLENIEIEYALWANGGFETIRADWNALSSQTIDETGQLVE